MAQRLNKRCGRGIAVLLAGLGLALHHVGASAALVDQGLTTFDTATGLEWLDMSQSIGISAQSIIQGTDPSNLSGAGWGLASITQITTLLTDGGMTAPFNGTISSGNYVGASLIMDLLGPTGATNLDFIQAFAGEGPVSGILFTPTLLASFDGCGGFCIGGAVVPGPGVPESVSNPTIGTWLVRSAVSVPEPSVLVLIAWGIAGLGFSRRKRAANIR